MPMTVRSVAEALGAEATGDLSIEVCAVAEPAGAGPGDLALAMEPRFADSLGRGAARAAVLWQGADWRALGLQAAIFAPRSRYVMAGIGRVFARDPGVPEGVHPASVVEDGATLGAGARVGPFVHVGAGARIGARATIFGHVSIGAGAVIGDDAVLHPHVHIGPRVTIGDRFIAQPGAVIGGDGFSFVSPERDAIEEARQTGQISAASRTSGFARINSLGGVRIGDDVEVGANAAVDRGTVADTTIGSGTKLDDLVLIGHNVKIGRHCLLCGHVGVAGSCVIGDRVVLAGAVGVADHLTIGSDVIVAAGSGVATHVAAGRIVMGYPAVRKDENIVNFKALRRLPRLMQRVAALEKRVSSDDASA